MGYSPISVLVRSFQRLNLPWHCARVYPAAWVRPCQLGVSRTSNSIVPARCYCTPTAAFNSTCPAVVYHQPLDTFWSKHHMRNHMPNSTRQPRCPRVYEYDTVSSTPLIPIPDNPFLPIDHLLLSGALSPNSPNALVPTQYSPCNLGGAVRPGVVQWVPPFFSLRACIGDLLAGKLKIS